MTHNYTCRKCENRWSGFYKKSDKISCPKCNSEKWDRIASPQFYMNPITDNFLRDDGIIDE